MSAPTACPICERDCGGTVAPEGQRAWCASHDYAGHLPPQSPGALYQHSLTGHCACGIRHDRRGARRPFRGTPAEPPSGPPEAMPPAPQVVALNGHSPRASANGATPGAHAQQAWPRLGEAALRGLAGDVVAAIAPHTEADPAALLLTFLVYFGNLVGRVPHALVTNSRHGTNLFAVLVGRTAGSRKGTSRAEIEALFGRLDADWLHACVQCGLSSGEGLISAVRDASVQTGKDGEPVLVQEGVSDKRLVVVEEEFCGPIKIMGREGNTLSAVVRQAWDGHTLGTMTRSSPLRATGPHISILGHTTQDELLKYLSESEMANGFANRFLWACVKRSQLLPHGGERVEYGNIVGRLQAAVHCARSLEKPLRRDPAANDRWALAYRALAREQAGLYGGVTSRAEAQCLRLSLLYALLDADPVVRVAHLEAALALWQYCADSARYIFGTSTGNSKADKVLDALRANPAGLTLGQIHGLFNRNMDAERLHMILDQLRAMELLDSRNLEGSDGGGGTLYFVREKAG